MPSEPKQASPRTALELVVLGEAPMHAAMRPSHLDGLGALFETAASWRAAVVVLALLLASTALGAPRAESPQECTVAADMAIVARSLAEEQIQRPQAGAIMSRIYELEASGSGKELMLQILDAAYIKKDSSTRNFAEELLVACLRNEGDMDSVLGHSA
jgi:hypothetical protein